jgi:HSP20 family protein
MTLVKRTGRSELRPSIWNNFFNNDLFNWENNFINSGNTLPAVNIKEKPDSFSVEMAAPGMDKKDFKIEIDGSALTISSEKQHESEEKEGENFNRKEFSYQSFYRSFHLPKEVVNADKIVAKYEIGFFGLKFPKKRKQNKSRHV